MKHLVPGGWTFRTLLGAAVLVAIGLGSLSASAGTEADLRAGYYADTEGAALGGGLLTPVATESPWYFNPNMELSFGDASNLYTINADLHYDLPTSSRVSYWVGAGPAILIADPDGRGSSNTNLGLNLFSGLGAARGEVRPFAQVKGIVSDNSQVALVGGVRF